MDVKVLLKEKRQELKNVYNLWAEDIAKQTKVKDFGKSSSKEQKLYNKIANKYAATIVALEDEITELEKKL